LDRFNRLAWVVVAATFVLVVAGASVTSTGSGLAVPDWPLSYGTLFPRMEGGVFFEHGHRMIAGVVLLLTTTMTVWLLRREQRAWVRRLSLAALFALFLQALLGGLTVLNRLPLALSVGHAALAMCFFAMTVSIALFTSSAWTDGRRVADRSDLSSARVLSLVTTCAIYVQIVLGAFVRHAGAGLAIPDFPLSYGRLFPPDPTGPVLIHYAHRVGAVLVSACVLALIVLVTRNRRRDHTPVKPAVFLGGLLLVQIVLGALTIWMQRAVVPTTAHVAVGAATLGFSLAMTLRLYRLQPARFVKPAPLARPAKLPAAAGATES
jgi:cytochrome c oxidase assembly protein subunit 15